MTQLSVQDWKTFLQARITQEQGDDERALQTFEDLLDKYPADPHLNASRIFALQRIGRPEEALVGKIAAEYAELGRTLVGDRDDPRAWTEALESVLAEMDEGEARPGTAAPLVVW